MRHHGIDAAGLATIDDVRWIGSDRIVGSGTHGVRGTDGCDERVVLWDASTGRPLRVLSGLPSMACLAVSADQRRLAAAGADKVVRLRDAQTLELLGEFRAHDGAIVAMSFHPDKPILATGSADLACRLWNTETGTLLEELSALTMEPRSMRFSPFGGKLAARDAGGTIAVWDFEGSGTAK